MHLSRLEIVSDDISVSEEENPFFLFFIISAPSPSYCVSGQDRICTSYEDMREGFATST